MKSTHVFLVSTLVLSTSGAIACNDDVAKGMWDVANSMGCPGPFYGEGHDNPNHYPCEQRRNRLLKQAMDMACKWNCTPEMANLYVGAVPLCKKGEFKDD